MIKSDKRQLWQLQLGAILCLLTSTPTAAQIVPDATLPVNSLVKPSGNTNIIEGGTTRGGNLFHSFSKFSLPTGNTAYFNNSSEVQNIFSRVTGGEISHLDGILKANATANLFFLNPNGIVFGANAQLNLGGSFLATTANNIFFADGTVYPAGIGASGATANQSAPLLTINVPVGLQFGGNPGAISVIGTGHSLQVSDPLFSRITGSNRGTGLQVSTGKTLALIGGDITLNGGILTAPGGRIELGSVARGNVSLNPTSSGWSLGYSGVTAFKDIQLVSKAAVDGSGSIAVQGRTVSISDGSILLIQNPGISPAGSLNVNASESLQVSGTTPDGRFPSQIGTEAVGTGKGGDIGINTKSLLVQNGANIYTRALNSAINGSINVNTSNSIEVLGYSPINPKNSSFIANLSFSSTFVGNITVSTEDLKLQDGGIIFSDNFGSGNGGDVTVNAKNSILISGQVPGLGVFSSLAAATLAAGNAGIVTVNTSSLMVKNGGRISTSSLATGNAGSIVINASESVEVSGKFLGPIPSSSVSSSATIVPTVIQKRFHLPLVPSGSSGNVTINTGHLSVTDDGLVNVKNDGPGNAGNLTVSAASILLNNGNIQAATASGEGGNISLQTPQLQLRQHSAITATAAGTGNGGNIVLTPEVLVALENSNITANAVQGRGGNIKISTQGIFLSPDSKITASSQYGVNGIVQINKPGIDPSQGLTDFSEHVVDIPELVSQTCANGRGSSQSNLAVTGRGGLPASPIEPLNGETVLVDWATPSASSRHLGAPHPSPSPSPSMVEATGWVVNQHGEVILVANAPTVTPHTPWYVPPTCSGNG